MRALLLVLCLCITAPACAITANTEDAGHESARGIARAIRSGRLAELARRSDDTLDAIIRVAVVNMRAGGDLYWRDADRIEWQWNHKYRGMLVRDALTRGIGSHHPLIQWLADAYAVIEAALGVEVCKALHLSDIETLNRGVVVVFNPRSFPMDDVPGARIDEYRRHFAYDDTMNHYYGVSAVVTWWGISIGCWAGTSGFGAFLCAIAATGGEWLMGHVLGPKLSDLVYHTAGGT